MIRQFIRPWLITCAVLLWGGGSAFGASLQVSAAEQQWLKQQGFRFVRLSEYTLR